AVHTEVLMPYTMDLRTQLHVSLGSCRQATRIALTKLVFVVSRWGDLQLSADRLDPESTFVVVDVLDHHLRRRSSSAWAKYADAVRRISLARLSSRFSRSSCFRRSRSEVLRPARLPSSRSACCTQRRNDSFVQPILLAIDWIAAHCESYSLRCSATIRTARSLTSAEYRFDVSPMAPSSQSMEPPGKSGRFTTSACSHCRRILLAHSARIGRALWPDSPPTMTQ